jgi:hypothetical protein
MWTIGTRAARQIRIQIGLLQSDARAMKLVKNGPSDVRKP